MGSIQVRDIVDSPKIVKAFQDIDNAVKSNLDILKKLTAEGANLNKQFSSGTFSSFVKSQSEFNNIVTTSNKVEASNIDLLKKKESLQKDVIRSTQARLKLEQEEERVKQQKIKTQQSTIRLLEQEKRAADKQAKQNAVLTSSYAQLSAKLNQSRAAAKDIGVTFGTTSKQFKTAQKEVLTLDKRLKGLDSSLGLSQRKVGAYENATKNLTRSLAGLAAGYLGLRGAIRLFQNIIGTLANFEQATTNLATIFGKTRKEISPLIKDAERLGAITAKSATEVVSLQDAYARLGFTQREIIDLTEGTIDGSIALNAGLSETAELVGAVVNTFDDLDTTDAGIVLDQLTLSTQKSALNFEKLNSALPTVAGAANAAGISFTRLVALLGKLSDSGIDASSSANALKRIFIESRADGLSYEQVLEKVANSSDKLTASVDEFGIRASVSSAILSKNIKSVSEFDEALQGAGGTASKVAKERLNTLQGSVTLLKSAWEGLILRFQDGNSILKRLVDGLTALVTFIQNNLTAIGNLIKGVVVATAAFTTWKIAILATALAQRLNLKSTLSNISINKLYVTATKLATIATKAFTKALQNNIFGIVATAIVAAATALLLFRKRTDAIQKLTNNIYKEANKQVVEQKNNIELLLRVARDEKRTLEERKGAIEKLNKISPEYLGNLKLETINTEAAKKATEKYIEVLIEETRVKVAKNKLDELEGERIDRINKGIVEQVGFWESLKNAIISGGNAASFFSSQQESGLKNLSKAEEDYLEQREVLLAIILGGNSDIVASETEVAKEISNSSEDNAKNIIKIEAAKLETKKLLREKDYIDEKQLLRKRFEEGFLDELAYKEELIKAELNYNNDIRAIQKQGINNELSAVKKGSDEKIQLNNRLKEIEIDAQKEKYDAQNEIDEINKERRLQFFSEEFEDSVKVIKEGQNKEEAVLEQGYLDGVISYENYRKKLEDAGFESGIRILEAEAAFVRKQLELLPENSKKRIELLQQLADKEIEIRKLKVDKEIDLEKKKSDTLKELGAELKQVAIDGINTIFENRVSKLEEEGARIDAETARRLENERLTDDQRAAIEQQATQRKLALEKRIKEQQRKQAIAQKAFAIIDIGIKTAQGITKTLATLGLPAAIPFIAVAAAIGAAQAAIVATQPIPQFEKGTKSAPGGISLVSEKGSELVQEPGGKTYLTPNSATLMNIPMGSVITPADKTQKLIENEVLGKVVRIDDWKARRDNNNMLKELKNLNKGIRKNRTMITINNSNNSFIDWKSRKIG